MCLPRELVGTFQEWFASIWRVLEFRSFAKRGRNGQRSGTSHRIWRELENIYMDWRPRKNLLETCRVVFPSLEILCKGIQQIVGCIQNDAQLGEMEGMFRNGASLPSLAIFSSNGIEHGSLPFCGSSVGQVGQWTYDFARPLFFVLLVLCVW